MKLLSEEEPNENEEEPIEIDEEAERLEEERVKQEREHIKKIGLEGKSKKAFSVLTSVDHEKEEERQKKLREKKFIGFDNES